MARIRKTILPPGTHHAPEGPVHVTPQRIRSWVAKHRAMRQAGIRIPVPWGHHSKARPLTADDKHFAASRFNAGYLDELSITPSGELEGVFDIPGAELDGSGNIVTEATLPDGRRVKTAISEVSAAIDDWKDGQKRLWSDSIVHVALTPLPVWAGQDGFRPDDKTPSASERRFSLSTLLFATEPDMAEEEPKDEGGEEKPEKGPPEKPKDESPAEGDNSRAGLVKRCIEGLAGCNPPIALPEDTDQSNFLERLNVALVAYAAATSGGADDGLGGLDDGAGGGPPPMTEAPGGAFMSLLRHDDPAVRQLAEAHKAALEQQQVDARTKRLSRIDGMVKRGLAPAIADDLRKAVGAVQLSLTRDGKPRPAAVDAQLSLLDRVLPRKGTLPEQLGKSATEEPPPHQPAGAVDEEMLWHASKGAKGKKPGAAAAK